jgi:mRNA interferase RelE/StbE
VVQKLDKTIAGRIRDRLREIAVTPNNPRTSDQLETSPDRRNSRVGDWRIIFDVDESKKIIDASTIQHRSKVYKELKK